MIQGYSTGIAVEANAAYPINNITFRKGCSAIQSGPATFQLNQRGVYLVHYDGYVAPSADSGTISTQLYVNGVARPDAISLFEATGIGDSQAMQFEALVQVAQNNCNCNLTSSGTTLQFVNGATAIEDAHINVTISKLI